MGKEIKDLKAYEILRELPLPDIDSTGYILRHRKSGARVALVSNSDENKVFYIGFRTTPSDDTGVAHIVEHTVLCGSEKFPLKDPFVELVKGSLNTFLNAMTYPDKTVYPVASCNEKDFHNLMDVYMDAVLHPNIYRKKEIFEQEGWHYEMEDPEGELTINGVVYNEMKGAFSSPEGVLDRRILNSLFPDTTYGNESGGDPVSIPELTYENYLKFHSTYYHPSNSYIYLYGDVDMVKELEWLDETYLSAYDTLQVDSEVAHQKPFTEIREYRGAYPVSSDTPLTENSYLSYNLAIADVLDRELYVAFEIIDYCLLGMPGAPLKQALLDAGIGKDIMGGYDNGTLQPFFSIVAKYADAAQKEDFLKVIRDCLQKQVKEGMDHKAILAAINHSEFRYREADFGSYPKGLIYGLQTLDSWLYDDMAVFDHLTESDIYAGLREKTEQGYFEKLVETWLLNNTHASLVIIEPEHGLNEREEQALKEKLQAYAASLTKEERQAIVEHTAFLKRYQEEPSTKEELELLPMLQREDLRREVLPLSNHLMDLNGCSLLHHDYSTNGITYTGLWFDCTDIPQEDLGYLGVLKAVLAYMDTEKYGYNELATEINLKAGGIAPALDIFVNAADDSRFSILFGLKVKALQDKLADAGELVDQILNKTDFTDAKRLKEILAETRSRLRMHLSSAGHTAASTRALSYSQLSYDFTDRTEGIAFYDLLTELEEHFEEKKAELIQRLQNLTARIFVKKRLMIDLTCDGAACVRALPVLLDWCDTLAEGKAVGAPEPWSFEKKNEGFTDASKIQYVSRVGNFRRHGYEYTGALRILKVILSYDYLWIRLRVKGGAYGCFGTFTRSGNVMFASYRDPNLRETNEVYEGIPAYLREFTVDERDMTKYIIGTFSDLDTPMPPATKGSRSMNAFLSGITEEMLQKERDQVLDAEQQDIRDLEPLITAALQDDCICVIGNEEKLQSEKDMFLNIRSF